MDVTDRAPGEERPQPRPPGGPVRSTRSARTPKSTYDRALHLLGFRARATGELRRALLRKGEPAAAVDEAIERLTRQRLLDDAGFATHFARTRVVGAGASRWRIVQELVRKGVARDVAEQAVDGLAETEGIDTTQVIHRVAEKKWNALRKLDPLIRRRRLYAFLARRGFSPDDIQSALRQLAPASDE